MPLLGTTRGINLQYCERFKAHSHPLGPHSGPHGVHKMGVTMIFRGLREIGQGRREYRRRIPKSAKAALGKSEWKRVITAKSDKELLRQYALVEAAFDQEVAAAKAPPAASAEALTPRAAWNEKLKQAEEMSAGVIGVDDPSEAREVVAEAVVSLGRSDPLLVQALIRRMGNAGRNGGEYYTPRPLIRAMIKVTAPKIGETIHDGAVGPAC